MMPLFILLLIVAPAVDPPGADVDAMVSLLEFVLDADEATAVACLDKLADRARSGELNRQKMAAIRERLGARLKVVLNGESDRPLYRAALVVATLWGDRPAADRLRILALNKQAPDEQRSVAMDTLATVQDAGLLSATSQLLTSVETSTELRGKLLAALARYEQPQVAHQVLEIYPKLDGELQPKAIGLVLQRPAWSQQLLAAISQGQLSRDVVNVNQIRSLLASRDPQVAAKAKEQFGSVRTERNPQREQVIGEMRKLLSSNRGNADRGQLVYQRVCGQCHRLHGTGQDVGPDITSNGRASFDQLLSNVFDPSLVIGPAYQAVTIVTTDGRVLTGILTEDSAQRVAIKTQGGSVAIVPRDDVEEVVASKLSLMPEGLERQLTPDELADLFALITLDRPPHDPATRSIPGTPVP